MLGTRRVHGDRRLGVWLLAVLLALAPASVRAEKTEVAEYPASNYEPGPGWPEGWTPPPAPTGMSERMKEEVEQVLKDYPEMYDRWEWWVWEPLPAWTKEYPYYWVEDWMGCGTTMHAFAYPVPDTQLITKVFGRTFGTTRLHLKKCRFEPVKSITEARSLSEEDKLAEGRGIEFQGQVQLELTDKPLGLLCDGSLAVQWFLADSAGQLVRPLGEVPLPANLRPNQPHTVSLQASLSDSDPNEGQIVGIIDLPSVYALGEPHPQDDLLRQARAIAQAVGLAPQKSCAGAVAEVAEREGLPRPDSGLSNNILRLPYTRQVTVDDPYIMELAVPRAVVAGDRFEVGIYLGYQNNLGRTAAEVRFRLWARPGPSQPAPAGGWQAVTIDRVPCCTVRTGFFDGLGQGSWEVVAEIEYPGDTDANNNRVVKRLEILRMQESEASGVEGGAITD